jgi:FKBP-type peptidyl-prolyl cis-trans isomerase SlyD
MSAVVLMRFTFLHLKEILPMLITKDTVVALTYIIRDAQNEVVETLSEPIEYLHGGYDDVFPKVEQALDGQTAGYTTVLQLEPHEAYGDYDTELVRVEPLDKFPEGVEVGMSFEGIPEDAAPDEALDDDAHDPDALIFTITDIAEGKVVLDGNHPFAGMALRFEVTVTNVRVPTEQELAQGFVANLEDDDLLMALGDPHPDVPPTLH